MFFFNSLKFIYVCKTQIGVQPLNDIQTSNLCRFLRQTSVPQIYVLFSNSQIYVLFQILKSIAVSHFLKSMFFFKFSNLLPFLTFSNRCLMTSLMYAFTLILTNKLTIDLRIWKGCQFENTLKSDRDLR
jgi:hypothetical protein